MADDQAFLSARVPKEVRNRFKMLAASRGVNVQALLREVVGDYLKTQSVPEAAAVIRALRAHGDELRELGVERLSLVGSVARGEATVDSDIDLVLGFKPERRLSLIDIAHIQHLLQTYIGDQHKVDVSLWKGMRETVEKTMRQDEVVIL
jgi:predicted nucleotidyltransferase